MIPENTLRWRALVEDNRGQFSVPLLLALMNRLSQGDPGASNEYGARGLFLIHPDTAAGMNVEPEGLIDPTVSIKLAVALLDDRMEKVKAAAARHGLWDLTDADFLRLTLPAYWWGPVPTISAIEGGAKTVREIWRAIGNEAGYADFADVILGVAEQYRDQLVTDGALDNGNGTSPGKPKSNRGLWVLAAVGAIGLIAWWDSKKGKKKK